MTYNVFGRMLLSGAGGVGL